MPSKSEESTGEVDYFADNGFGNAVALVQHPAGVYHNGITYVAYQGPLEDPYVASYKVMVKIYMRFLKSLMIYLSGKRWIMYPYLELTVSL